MVERSVSEKSKEVENALKMMEKVLSGNKEKHVQKKNKRELKDELKQMRKIEASVKEVPTGSIVEVCFTPSVNSFKGETPVVAVDCEMVQVDKSTDALAR